MIVIATVGRSGSSFLAKWFKECGFDIGSDTWFEPFKAGYENKQTLDINQRLIRKHIKGERVNEYYIWGDIHDLKLDVIKDPQFLISPVIIKNWWKVRKDIKVVFLYRKPEEIVESCKKLPEWTGPVYRCFPELIEEKQEAFLDQLDKSNIPYERFKYPSFLGQYYQMEEVLKSWNIELPVNAEDKWNQLRDR